MASQIEFCATWLALGLAGLAAIMSAPGQAERTHQTVHWVELSFGPEAAAVSGAIGEHPEQLLAP